MIAGDFQTLVSGKASGPVVLLSAPLSLWGGLDLDTGCICDVSHPNVGQSLTNTILVMTGGRGSSSSSSALVEAVRRGIAPAAIILSRVDPILVIGGLVAADLYDAELPILLADQYAFANLGQAKDISITANSRFLAVVTQL